MSKKDKIIIKGVNPENDSRNVIMNDLDENWESGSLSDSKEDYEQADMSCGRSSLKR